jgi:hypothetical protein
MGFMQKFNFMGRALLFGTIKMPNFGEIYASGRTAPILNGITNIGLSDNSVVNGVAGYTELFSSSIIQGGNTEEACLNPAITLYANQSGEINADVLVFDNASGFSQTGNVYFRSDGSAPEYFCGDLDGNGYHSLTYVADCKG